MLLIAGCANGPSMASNCAGWSKSVHTAKEIQYWSKGHKKWVVAHDSFGIKQKCWK